MFKNIATITFLVIFVTPFQLSYADNDSFTVNVPSSQGRYTPVVIQKSGSGYVGPQGEFYSQFPSVAQLKVMYVSSNGNSSAVNYTEQRAQSVVPKTEGSSLSEEEKSVINKLFSGDESKSSLDTINGLIVSGSPSVYLSYGYLARGDFFRYNHNFEQAISDYNKSIETNTNSSMAYEGRGSVNYLKGDYGQAILDYTQALQSVNLEKDINGNPMSNNQISVGVIHQYRGIVYFVRGEYSLAIGDFNVAIQNMPDFIYCYYFKGRAYDQLGNHGLAVNNYEAAVQKEHAFNAQTIQNNQQLNNPKGEEDGINIDIDRMVKGL